MARPLQEINAGSMADIAFLLLIFFLVTTTMDKDSGIIRKLPPSKPENYKAPDVHKRNLFVVLINKHDQLAVRGRLADLKDLCKMTKDFVANPGNESDKSEKSDPFDVQFLGKVTTSKGIISLQNDRGTSYAMYLKVQNELVKAFDELREELSQKEFKKTFDDLPENKQEAIKKVYPMAISESEAAQFGEKK